MARLKHLWSALDFQISDLLRIDLLVGVGGGTVVGVLAGLAPERVISSAPWAAGVVVAIIGAVVTGLSVQVAFLDQPFLRKLRVIDTDPVRLLAPFMFTAVLGVIALLPTVIVANLSSTTPEAVICTVGAFAGLTVFWTVASVLPDLDTLVQFVQLKIDALDVPDDVDLRATKARDVRVRDQGSAFGA